MVNDHVVELKKVSKGGTNLANNIEKPLNHVELEMQRREPPSEVVCA